MSETEGMNDQPPIHYSSRVDDMQYDRVSKERKRITLITIVGKETENLSDTATR